MVQFIPSFPVPRQMGCLRRPASGPFRIGSSPLSITRPNGVSTTCSVFLCLPVQMGFFKWAVRSKCSSSLSTCSAPAVEWPLCFPCFSVRPSTLPSFVSDRDAEMQYKLLVWVLLTPFLSYFGLIPTFICKIPASEMLLGLVYHFLFLSD